MTKGLKKRVIILSLCLTTLYLLPTDTYAQDEPGTDQNTIQQQPGDQSAPSEQDQALPIDSYKGGIQKDDIFGDSLTRFNSGDLWGFVGHGKGGGYQPYSAGGGPGPLDPPPDPDASVPIDNGVLLLIAVGIAYGFRRLYLYRRTIAIA